jgi:hypothetical protein
MFNQQAIVLLWHYGIITTIAQGGDFLNFNKYSPPLSLSCYVLKEVMNIYLLILVRNFCGNEKQT